MFVACKQYGGEFGGRIHNKRRILSSLGDDVRVNCSRNCEENEEDGSSHSCDVDWRVGGGLDKSRNPGSRPGPAFYNRESYSFAGCDHLPPNAQRFCGYSTPTPAL